MDITALRDQAIEAIERAKNAKELEEVNKIYLGRKGKLTQLLRSLNAMEAGERRKIGAAANALRDELHETLEKKQELLARLELQEEARQNRIDVTVPGKRLPVGHLHPLTHIQREARRIFESMGFSTVQGNEIESQHYNFDALNFPPDHPARDMQDTFWLKQHRKGERNLLRTHTSPVQVRYMEQHVPPFRIIVPGRVFRNEATDARHETNLYQLEGLMVGKYVSAAHFKGVLEEFYREFFHTPVSIRLRPSFFPFVEPGFEVDMSCVVCKGGGCSTCSQGGWIEMMGAGMVHPNVFKAAGYVPGDWQGFAFGMGLDRLAMMKYKVHDIRLFYGGDFRFLRQF
ncbi:MAG: phenylalanine--tRNA ligase subunit alpha [Candidatus Yanofskybacteria bacterium]|nr:phenylalanine--tRNA ligase subunit alpha [Candidatus Yanofskybacteria bacterium]